MDINDTGRITFQVITIKLLSIIVLAARINICLIIRFKYGSIYNTMNFQFLFKLLTIAGLSGDTFNTWERDYQGEDGMGRKIVWSWRWWTHLCWRTWRCHLLGKLFKLSRHFYPWNAVAVLGVWFDGKRKRKWVNITDSCASQNKKYARGRYELNFIDIMLTGTGELKQK